jgi:hypothetical protein
MALKSGASHAFSTLILTMVGALLVQYLKHVSFFEYLFKINESIAIFLANGINMLALVYVPTELLEYVTIAFFLSFLWGVGYHLARAD